MSSSSAAAAAAAAAAASASASSASPSEPFEFFTYLQGTWKRALEWRQFGGNFDHVRTSNMIAKIEQIKLNDPTTRWLRWSFGKQIESMSYFHDMKCTFEKATGDWHLEWQYSGSVCHGKLLSRRRVCLLNFVTPNSVVTVTLRVVDANVMAVCNVEVDERAQTIQYGTMMRVDPTRYVASEAQGSSST